MIDEDDLPDDERAVWTTRLTALAAETDDPDAWARWLSWHPSEDQQQAIVRLATILAPRLEGALLDLCLYHGGAEEALARPDLAPAMRNAIAQALLDMLTGARKSVLSPAEVETTLVGAFTARALTRAQPAIATFVAEVVADSESLQKVRSRSPYRWTAARGYLVAHISDAKPDDLVAAIRIGEDETAAVATAVHHPNADQSVWRAAMEWGRSRNYGSVLDALGALATEPRVQVTTDIRDAVQHLATTYLHPADRAIVIARLALGDPPPAFACTFRQVVTIHAFAAIHMLAFGTDDQLAALTPEDIAPVLVAPLKSIRLAALRALARVGAPREPETTAPAASATAERVARHRGGSHRGTA